MNRQDRAVTPVIAIILMVAVLIVLAAAISVTFLGVTEDINEPAPNVADTTGEFIPGGGGDEQVVRITHTAGDSVGVENIEIIVRASGPGVDEEVRLIDLPGDGHFTRSLDDENIEGNDDFIDQGGTNPLLGYSGDQVIVVEDSNVWTASDTIQFSVNSGEADFREGESEADELEVIIVHTPSNAILSEHMFTP